MFYWIATLMAFHFCARLNFVNNLGVETDYTAGDRGCLFGPIEYKQYKIWFERDSGQADFSFQESSPSPSPAGKAYFQVWGPDDRAVLELDYEVTEGVAMEAWGRGDASQAAVEEGTRLLREIIDKRGQLSAPEHAVPHLRCRIERI